jgi:glycosyltransferase involved in cell wall biosynthesis
MSKSKILFIHHGLGIGGAPKSLLQLASSLDTNYFEVKVAVVEEGPAAQMFRENKLEVINLNHRVRYLLRIGEESNYINKVLKLFKLVPIIFDWIYVAFYFGPNCLKNIDADIVHFNSHILTSWAFAAKSLRKKVVIHNREAVTRGIFGLRYYFVRFIISNYCDILISISKDNQKRLGLYGSNSVVIYNPTLIPNVLPFNETNSTFRVLYLGGGSDLKGFNVLIESLKYLNNNIKIYFAGKYDDKNQSPAKKIINFILSRKVYYIEDYKSDQHVVYIGMINDLSEYFNEVDLLISPHTVPHFSRPVIESYSFRKPVLVSRIEGMNEIVDENITGVFFKNRSPNDLANKLNSLSSDINFVRNMGLNSRQFAINKFSIEAHISSVQEIYSQILD